MLVKHEMIPCPFQETSYTAITLNHKSNSTRREKNHSLFHWSTSTSPEVLIPPLMHWTKAASIIFGTVLGQEICGDWPNGKQHQGLIICGQKCGEVCQATSKWGEAKWRKRKNQSSRLPENFDVFDSSNPRMRNSRRSSKMHRGNLRSQQHLLCLVKMWMAESMGRPVAGTMITSRNWRVSWKQRNRRDCVWKGLYQGFSKTLVQEKRIILCNVAIWYTNWIRCLKQWKYLKPKQPWTKMGKTWENFGVESDQGQKQIWSERRSKQVHCASLMDFCHLKNAEIEKNDQKYQGRVVLRGDIVKHDSDSYAAFTEQESSASQMTAGKVMDIISRLSGCAGQAADAVSAYTSKNGRCSQFSKIPKSECPDTWIRLPRHKWPKSWSSMEDPIVLLKRNLYGHPLAGLLWERQFVNILLQHGWEKVSNWECLFVHREKGLFLSVCVDDIQLAGKKQDIVPLWTVLNKEVDLENQLLSLIMYNWAALRHCEIGKEIVENCRTMFESRISARMCRASSRRSIGLHK